MNSIRSDEQLEKLDRARQMMIASWMIPLEASQIPRSLQGPRRLSRRPEHRLDFGPVLMPRTAGMVKAEDQSAMVGQKKAGRKKKASWK